MIDTSYLVSNDAGVRRVRDLDAKLDAAFGTEAEIREQIAEVQRCNALFPCSDPSAERQLGTAGCQLGAGHGSEIQHSNGFLAWDDATWTVIPLQVGRSRQFQITGSLNVGTLIHVYRVESDLYVVTVTVDGKLVPHFTQTWTPERSPDGDVRRAAWDYIQSVAADLGGSVKA